MKSFLAAVFLALTIGMVADGAVAQVPVECGLGNVHTTAGIALDPALSSVQKQGDGTLVGCRYVANGSLSLSGQIAFRIACPTNTKIVFPGYNHKPQFKQVATGAGSDTVRVDQRIVGISSVTLSDLTEVAVITLWNPNEIKELALDAQAHCRDVPEAK